MIEELRKRPMVRLLLIWITGIILQTSYDIGCLSLFLLVIPFFIVLLSFIRMTGKNLFVFSNRWIWGVCFSLLLLFLSIQFTVFKEEGRSKTLFTGSRLENILMDVRDHSLSIIDRLEIKEDEKSVLATITLGYRKHLSKDIRQSFSLSGTAHILAVSGMHVAILCSFFTFVLSLLPFKNKNTFLHYLITIVFIWGYVCMTGAAASAIRAGLMLSFYLTGRYLVKNTDSWNSMAATAFCMLVVNPFYLFDLGFQLSFIAVAFILYVEPLIRQPFEIRNPLVAIPFSWFTVACAAQIGVTLLSIYYFGYVSPFFLFTALPVSLLVTCLLPASCIWLLLPDWMPGYTYLQIGVEWGIHSLCGLVDGFSSIEGYILFFSLSRWEILLGYILLIGIIEYFRRRYGAYLHKKSYL